MCIILFTVYPLADPGFEVGGGGSSGIHKSESMWGGIVNDLTSKKRKKRKKGRLCSSLIEGVDWWISGGGGP